MRDDESMDALVRFMRESLQARSDAGDEEARRTLDRWKGEEGEGEEVAARHLQAMVPDHVWQQRVGERFPMPEGYRFPKFSVSEVVCESVRAAKLTPVDLSERLRPTMTFRQLDQELDDVKRRSAEEEGSCFFFTIDDVAAVEGMLALAFAFYSESVRFLVQSGATEGGVFPRDAQLIAFHRGHHAFLSDIRTPSSVKQAMGVLLDAQMECALCLEPLLESAESSSRFSSVSRLACGHCMHPGCWKEIDRCPICRETRTTEVPKKKKKKTKGRR